MDFRLYFFAFDKYIFVNGFCLYGFWDIIWILGYYVDFDIICWILGYYVDFDIICWILGDYVDFGIIYWIRLC